MPQVPKFTTPAGAIVMATIVAGLMLVMIVLAMRGHPSPAAALQPASAADVTALESALTACRDSQQAIYDALNGSDKVAALESLTAGRENCHAAAAALRQTPLPGEGPQVAYGLDQMADGLSGIETAVRNAHRSPRLAHRQAMAAFRLYQQGLALLPRRSEPS